MTKNSPLKSGQRLRAQFHPLPLLVILFLSALLSSATAQAQTPTTAYVGLGATDPGTHQLVRNTANVLYLVPFDCNTGFPDCGPNSLHAYAGNRPGQATAYIDKDAAHAPHATSIRSSAIAIDGRDVIHVVYNDNVGNGHVYYIRFDTKTNLWGKPTLLSTTYWTNDAAFTQGAQGVSIALDSHGHPHVLYSARASVGGPVRVFYTHLVDGIWTKPILLDDQAVPAAPRYSYHPTLAFTPTGELLTAWIQGSCNVKIGIACYTPDGVVYTRLSNAAGVWQNTVSIPDLTFPSLDNGPSLLVTADGTKHITFCNAAPGHENEIRYWYDNGHGWLGDEQTPTQVTHDPSLGPDGKGGLYIYGHGAPPPGDYSGYGPNKYTFHKAAGSKTWGPWTLYVEGPYDDATSTRWSQFFYNYPGYLDATYWTYTTPYQLYVGTLISRQP